MRSKSILSGINVPIEPTSNVDSHVTNSIMIKNISYPDLQDRAKTDIIEENQENDNKEETKAVYGSAGATRSVGSYPSTFNTRDLDNPYAQLNSVDEYLRELYQSILLTENKKLLANLITKKSIILTKEDLEEVIKRKISKTCTVDCEDSEPNCCGISSPFIKINGIRVLDDSGAAGTDFQIQYNKDYQELVTTYHICMRYVLVN